MGPNVPDLAGFLDPFWNAEQFGWLITSECPVKPSCIPPQQYPTAIQWILQIIHSVCERLT